MHASSGYEIIRDKRNDQYIPDAKGQSRISFEDYAVAVIDELEHGNHVRARFGVAY